MAPDRDPEPSEMSPLRVSSVAYWPTFVQTSLRMRVTRPSSFFLLFDYEFEIVQQSIPLNPILRFNPDGLKRVTVKRALSVTSRRSQARAQARAAPHRGSGPRGCRRARRAVAGHTPLTATVVYDEPTYDAIYRS